MKQATIKDAPAVLNTNDRAMWVLGFNEALERCRAACEAQRPKDYMPDGEVFEAGVDACINALGVDSVDGRKA
jgi:hypothetical protein